MGIPAVLVVVPVGLLFILSGLLVNLIQAVFFILVRPLSKNMYRRINKVVAELLWLELICLVDWWAGVKVMNLFCNTIELYTDSETFQLMGKEHALFICNHRSDIDWLVGWVLAQRLDCLGSTLAIMKKAVKSLPVIGWSMWFSGYVFVERNWAKDENTLKGFVSAVSHMRSFVPAIYDCTVAVPKDQPPPTMLRILRGKSSVVKVHIRRHSMLELPETADGISQWCKDAFVTKDALLEKYLYKGSFSDLQKKDIGRPKKSLFVVICWLCLIVYGVVKFFQWSSLLSSLEGIAFLVIFLVLVTFLMHILIQSSESERSTPVNILTQDPVEEQLLQK
ncbi:1-acyl-sn-glycerol-3-phosphate acyltransferase 2 [Quercus suber]|uniref:1-acylglycerol-3-phosphate O-acyltransferase n=1 Tax=Quercus suber TaxID=58331 RepID=A0AAW0K186_QUESU